MFDRLGGQFTWCPGIDWPPDIGRWGTGQIDNLDDLFGCKATRSARAWRIGEDGGDQRAQIAGMLLDGSELRFSLGPASAPLAHGGKAAIERQGECIVALPASGPKHDLHSKCKGLGTGGLAQQPFEERLLRQGKRNYLRLWPSHKIGAFGAVWTSPDVRPYRKGYHNLKRTLAKLY